jgi:hypothetical protein
MEHVVGISLPSDPIDSLTRYVQRVRNGVRRKHLRLAPTLRFARDVIVTPCTAFEDLKTATWAYPAMCLRYVI